MRPGPSKAMEAMAAILIPPACREEVLGDLHERYKSRPQYIADVSRAIPLVIWSQVRRTTEPQVVLLEALAIFLAFLAVQWLVDGPSGFLRLAIPALAMLVGSRLGVIYARRAWASLFAVSFAFLLQGGLWVVNPELAVPRWIMIFGASLAAMLLYTVQVWFPQRGSSLLEATAGAGPVLSLEDIRRKALEFQERISRRNLREYAAAAIVLVSLALGFPKAPLGSGIAVAGIVYVVWQLRARGAARTPPPDGNFAIYLDFHRDLLRSIWSWYLGPMIPGLAVFAVREAMRDSRPVGVFVIFVAVLFLGIAKLNFDAARKLQREIDELDAMEIR